MEISGHAEDRSYPYDMGVSTESIPPGYITIIIKINIIPSIPKIVFVHISNKSNV